MSPAGWAANTACRSLSARIVASIMSSNSCCGCCCTAASVATTVVANSLVASMGALPPSASKCCDSPTGDSTAVGPAPCIVSDGCDCALSSHLDFFLRGSPNPAAVDPCCSATGVGLPVRVRLAEVVGDLNCGTAAAGVTDRSTGETAVEVAAAASLAGIDSGEGLIPPGGGRVSAGVAGLLREICCC